MKLQRISSSLSRTSRADGRTIGALLSILRIRLRMCGTARNASSSYSQDAFSSIVIHVSSLSRLAWNEVSVRELLPPMVIFCFKVLCLTNSWGFFLSMNDRISRYTQPKEKISAFSVSCTRERGFGIGFVLLKPKLNPANSVVGTLVNFCRCELLLFEDPDELLLMIDACRVLGTIGAGAAASGSKFCAREAWASGAPYM